MMEINLLPWRDYLREKKKKTHLILMLAIIILILGFISLRYLQLVHRFNLEQQRVTGLKKQLKQATKKSHEMTGASTPTQSNEIKKIFFDTQSQSHSKNISIDFQNVNLREALQLLAEIIPVNLVISSLVEGVVSLQLKNVTTIEAFDLLTASHGLIKRKIGGVWIISQQSELMKQAEQELKLQQLMDDVSSLETRTWQIHFARADDLAHLLQDNNHSFLSKRGHVRFDARTNILCVQDIPERIVSADRLIKRLDVPQHQILIEARLASVDSDFERELGVSFAVSDGDDAATTNTISSAKTRYSIAVAKLADGSLLDVRLAALENEGHGELISSPSLFTANRETASIESGEEIPYQESSRNGATSIAFKKAVLRLKVTPLIMPDNKVLLQLQINQDKPSNHIVLGVPAINTRQITTNVLLKNGETIVLGGIYESNIEQSQQRIPFLGKIPLVGFLFRQQNAAKSKRELLIFVTPKIEMSSG